MLSMFSLFSFIILAVLIFLWKNAMQAKEVASSVANSWCAEKQFQLLDETVALKKISWKRNSLGKIQFLRRYQFEYTVEGSDQRFSIELELLGDTLYSINNATPEEKVVAFKNTHH